MILRDPSSKIAKCTWEDSKFHSFLGKFFSPYTRFLLPSLWWIFLSSSFSPTYSTQVHHIYLKHNCGPAECFAFWASLCLQARPPWCVSPCPDSPQVCWAFECMLPKVSFASAATPSPQPRVFTWLPTNSSPPFGPSLQVISSCEPSSTHLTQAGLSDPSLHFSVPAFSHTWYLPKPNPWLLGENTLGPNS